MRRDVALTIVTRVLITVAGLASGIVTARYLGDEGRGEYFFAVTLAAAVVQFANVGLHSSNTYQVASERSLLGSLTANSLWVSIALGGGGGLLAASLLPAAGLFPDVPRSTFWLAAALAPASLFFLLGANLLVGVNRIGTFNAVEAGSRVFLLVVLFGAGIAGWGAHGFLGVSIAAWTLVGVVLLALLLRDAGRRLRFDRSAFAAGFRYATRSYAISLLGFFVLRANVFLLEHIKGSESVGQFSIATQAADGIAILPSSMALVLFPALVRDRSGRWAQTLRGTAVVSVLLAVSCVAVGLLAHPLVRIAFGAQYLPAVPMLRLLLPGVFALGALTVLTQYLAAIGQPRALIAVWGAALALVVGLGLVLIPDHSGEGAAVALSITYGALLLAVATLGIRYSRRAAPHTEGEPEPSATFALTTYPLSRDYRQKLASTFAQEPAYVNVAQLRRLPVRELLRTLRGLKGQRCLLPLEDEDSAAMLPVLRAVAALASPSALEVVHPDGRRESIGRRGVLRATGALARASLAGRRAMRGAGTELEQLMAAPRIDVTPGAGRRILYLNGNVWYGLKAGGSVGHVAGVVNALHRLDWEVELAASTDPVTVDADVPVHRLRLPQPLGLPLEANGYRFQPDMVEQSLEAAGAGDALAFVYQRMSLANWAGVVVSRRLERPLVLEYNGSEVWAARHWGKPLRFETLATRAEDVCLRHAHVVVTISDVLRDELLARGVEPERLVVHPNCVDPERVDPDRFSAAETAVLRAGLGIPGDAIVVTFVGTFGRWHGAPVLAEAVRRLATEDEDWLRAHRVRFLFVGDGVQMAEVRSLAGEGPPAPYVVLTGLVPQEDAPLYLAASDVLVSPHVPNPDGSPFFGSPTKLFEYMASGRPIVASDLDQIGDVLRESVHAASLPDGPPADGKLAVLAEPGSVDELVAGIRFLVERPDWRAALGVEARREVLARYTWRHHVEAILERVGSL